MKFDLYLPMTGRGGEKLPGIKPQRTEYVSIRKVMASEEVSSLIDSLRTTNDKKEQEQLKKQLPAVCFTGTTSSTRAAANMQPTQLVMIDIDHIKGDVVKAWGTLFDEMHNYKPDGEELQQGQTWVGRNLVLAYITCRGAGLRIVFRCQPQFATLQENIDWFGKTFDVARFGDNDTAIKDFSRLSFLSKASDILFESAYLVLNEEPQFEEYVRNELVTSGPAKRENTDAKAKKVIEGQLFADFTEAEVEEFEGFEYRGVPVRRILDKYMEMSGEPSSGERHNFYNELVKNFRVICDNNKRLLLYLLPRFGHTIEECSSQIGSICRVNTLSSIPKSFYFFLKDNGFYNSETRVGGSLKEALLSEPAEPTPVCPYFPPVIRQLVETAPADFQVSVLNALLPILGTLTSYVGAEFPYDNRIHTTRFFSVIYAPAGTGKGFVERFIDLLFERLKIRDFVQSERENVYLRSMNRRSQNEKAPDRPHTSLRIIPAKNSEAEFLEKQRDNQGYHMFTYAAEMDSWAKGVRAAGGNKDDMIRIAWDNGEYGQQFKSTNTFKGMVRLYWNVLITGTLPQVESYFKNVENGLVSRCSFSSIEDQEFKEAPVWKSLNKRGKDIIRRFVERCDMLTYEKPCEINYDDLLGINDEDFDREVNWRFEFREREIVDVSWVMPVINAWHKREIARSALNVDHARDVFRRRVGVRGFRLALLCHCLFSNMREVDKRNCCKFIAWWMDRDLENMLKLWGERYNEQFNALPKKFQREVFSVLNTEFDRTSVYATCVKLGIKTPVRRIIHEWKKLGYVEETGKDTYKKVNNVKK